MPLIEIGEINLWSAPSIETSGNACAAHDNLSHDWH